MDCRNAPTKQKPGPLEAPASGENKPAGATLSEQSYEVVSERSDVCCWSVE